MKKKRPLLSALIIHKGKDKEQGDGFYKLCQDIYNKNWEDLKANKNFEIEKITECLRFGKIMTNIENLKMIFKFVKLILKEIGDGNISKQNR